MTQLRNTSRAVAFQQNNLTRIFHFALDNYPTGGFGRSRQPPNLRKQTCNLGVGEEAGKAGRSRDLCQESRANGLRSRKWAQNPFHFGSCHQGLRLYVLVDFKRCHMGVALSYFYHHILAEVYDYVLTPVYARVSKRS